jgi:AbiEi antitoxin C-terminal domain
VGIPRHSAACNSANCFALDGSLKSQLVLKTVDIDLNMAPYDAIFRLKYTRSGSKMAVSTAESKTQRVPRWAAPLVARLTQDLPSVLTRSDIESYLHELGMHREPEGTIRALVRLGWLRGTSSHGVWEFLPLGETLSTDPYLPLRAWRADEPEAVFALAGEAAAWHLGYLDRPYNGPVRVWLPEGQRVPFGARPHVAVVRLGWSVARAHDVGPDPKLLRRKRLDMTQWSTGLLAFGPEALLAQVSIRPASFEPWADLAAHIVDLAADCQADRLLALLDAQRSTAWQRAAYLLNIGGANETANAVMEQRGSAPLSHVTLGSGPEGDYSARFNLTDRVVAPLRRLGGKA